MYNQGILEVWVYNQGTVEVWAYNQGTLYNNYARL